MKRFLFIAIMFATTIVTYSQALGYQDLALLFSQSDQNGTARYTAMGGAFGALGGDISSININPAGISVYKNSIFSGTFNSRFTNINTKYYGNSIKTQNEYVDISQIGAVLVFDTANDFEWSKFVLGFNYLVNKDFKNSFTAKGNSRVATFTEYPKDTNKPKIAYNNADKQQFSTIFGGETTEFNFGISALYNNKLHLGLSFNSYDLKFNQQADLDEFNNDGNKNNLDTNLYQENITTGTAYSLSAGFIYKVHQNFRFGLSYQTPTWFTEVLQDTNYQSDSDEEIGKINYTQGNEHSKFTALTESIAYKLKTPSKITASAAVIFGKMGLISIDYSMKNYQKIQLSDGLFTNENNFFQNSLRNTYSINIGTEWRLDRFSIRGGYVFKQSPDKNALNSDNFKGYSFGGGYNFGTVRIDLSYSNNNKTGLYNFYPQFNNVNAADLNIDNRIVSATLTLDL